MVHSRTKEPPCPEIPLAFLAWLERRYPDKLPGMPSELTPDKLEMIAIQVTRLIGRQDVLLTVLTEYENQQRAAKKRGM